MTARDAARRACSAQRIWLAFAVWWIGFAVPAAAQQPDTVPRDTVPSEVVQIPIPPEAVASDTLPGDSIMPEIADTLGPVPQLPQFPDPLPTGFAFGRWELTRDELLRYRGLSVLDLLERIPGIVVTRSGGFGRTAGVSALGSGGSAVRVFVDGFEIDPIGQPTPELQAIGLIDLETLRVERGPDGVRLELKTFTLAEPEPYSEVEAAAGNYGARLLRALLARQAGSRGIFSASYDLVTTNGIGLFEPFQAGAGRVSASYALTPTTGLRIELRQGSVERGGAAYPIDISRRDLLLGARSAPLPGITAEALIGRTWWDPETGDAGREGAAMDTVRPDVRRTQALLRAAWTSSLATVEATARARSGGGGAPGPGSEVAVRGMISPRSWVTAEGELRSAGIGGARATSARGGARIGPIAGVSAFATVHTGERWLALVRDTSVVFPDTVRVDTVLGVPVPVVQERARLETVFSSGVASSAGARVGAEITRWGGTLGAALVAIDAGVAAPFGFGFDRRIRPVTVQAGSGIEAYVSLPVPRTGGALRLEGFATRWADTGGRPYLPEQEARLALEFHTVRIEGQFEPTLRVEAVHRGRTLVPARDGEAYGFVTQPYSLLNLLLQIRILDVRAFLIWENPTHNRLALDLPEGLGFQPGQRLIYGARWMFRN